jgi:Type IV secretion-system coupling protein DNA-binding domain
MNGELPLIAIGGSGAAMLAGIHVRERRAEEAMRSSRVRLRLTFPAGVDPLQAKAALSAVAGLDSGQECVFSVEATASVIRHCLFVPATARRSVTASLIGVMPGLQVSEGPAPSGRATLAAKVYLPTPLVLSTEQPEAAARTLLSGLVGLTDGEHAVLRIAIRPGSGRPWSSSDTPTQTVRHAERLWRQKVASGVGFNASALILVRAASLARAREICEHLTSCLRSRRGPVGTLRITSERGNRSLAALPRTTRSSGWVTASELLSLLPLPLGDPIPGLEVGGARQLTVPRYVPTKGLRLLIGRDSSGNPTPVALTQESARLHLGLIGSTGSGKTTVLIRLILDALAEGIGGVFLDPKDAIEKLLDHVPPELADRIVVLDPSVLGPLPGLDLFGAGDPVVRSDVILSVIKGGSDSWGVRIERFLRLGLRSLSALPDPVLFDWLRIFSDPAFRHSVVARITDPIIAAEWRMFEELSSPEQQAYVAPALARVTDLLSRPALRAVLSQPQPKLNLERLLSEGRWLCVALSPGTLGEPAAQLLGGIVSYLVWTAVEKRAAIPESQRRQVMFVLDELQSLANLPVGLEVFFERTRSLNCAVVVATQALSRLPETTRVSLLANVGSLLSFRGGADEALRLARELAPMTAADIVALARYEIVGRVNTGSAGPGRAIVTGTTEPLPAPTGMADHVRALSAERYGRDPREVEDQLRQRGEVTREDITETDTLGRTQRRDR